MSCQRHSSGLKLSVPDECNTAVAACFTKSKRACDPSCMLCCRCMPAASRMALSATATGEAGCLKSGTPTSTQMQAAGLSGVVEGTMCHDGWPVFADCTALPRWLTGAVVAMPQVCGDCSPQAGEGSRVASCQQGQPSLRRHADVRCQHCMWTLWGPSDAVQPSPSALPALKLQSMPV